MTSYHLLLLTSLLYLNLNLYLYLFLTKFTFDRIISFVGNFCFVVFLIFLLFSLWTLFSVQFNMSLFDLKYDIWYIIGNICRITPVQSGFFLTDRQASCDSILIQILYESRNTTHKFIWTMRTVARGFIQWKKGFHRNYNWCLHQGENIFWYILFLIYILYSVYSGAELVGISAGHVQSLAFYLFNAVFTCQGIRCAQLSAHIRINSLTFMGGIIAQANWLCLRLRFVCFYESSVQYFRRTFLLRLLLWNTVLT